VNHCPASFSNDPSVVAAAEAGQLGHRDTVDHTAQFERTVHRVRDGVWSAVGNGLSNQAFVEGPDGLIAIDTGESIQEMAWSIDAMKAETDAAIVAVVYTHSHYVGGTAAIEGAGDSVPVWGHSRIVSNRERTGVEISASATRGAVHQFGLFLPPDGPDGLINVGLGQSFRRADHAPHEVGFVVPTHTFDGPTTTELAGLKVEITPAPSDADDSVTIWFPELDTVVHNIAWPVLFNVFAIRGEPYRDPQVLIRGIDHILELAPEHLVGAHGVPLSGRDHVRHEVTLDRDSIQFMWDQTVRGVNKDLRVAELGEFVQLPEVYATGQLTRQLYGVAEHHVRQIHHGLVGWFDGDESTLFPLLPGDRSKRLVEGFGGEEIVREAVRTAIDDDDLRWAVEMGSWLVRRTDEDGEPLGTDADCALLAEAIRAIGQRTSAANIRNWCLTRALELEGTIDLSRLRTHVFGRGAVLGAQPAITVHAMRVLVDPEAASGVDDQLRWRFTDGVTVGLHVRNHVAVPTDGAAAELEVALDIETWAAICSGRTTIGAAIGDGSVSATGDRARIDRIIACFDHPGFRS
jgi:alkyl sulfatase BDS1-like metallo-beta-lactamase superfamily hydrolase